MNRSQMNQMVNGGSGSAIHQHQSQTNAQTNAKSIQSTSSSSSSTGQPITNVLASTSESVKLMAESIGILNLSEDACKEIINDLTSTLKFILLDAQKFSRRSRRKDLTSADIDYSLKVHSIEPIYGFCTNESLPFRCTTTTGGNGSGRCIYYLEDQVLDLNDVISVNNSSIKLPNDFVINAHWLAIEGIQPSVPENPQLMSREIQKKEAIEGVAPIKSKEKQTVPIQKKIIGENLVKLKTLVPHDLSIEQQFYFKEITEACVGSDEQKRTEALNSLSIDPGLHQLLPRFILFISEGVRLNILQTNMAILIYLMRMAKALIENKSIYLEKYLHELLPSIFSCLLSKNLCARPEIDNHYALREYCARLIGQVLKTYGPTLTFLQTRIIKVYLSSIESEKATFSTLFGAIVGIAELGDDICETVIFPLIKILGDRLSQVLDSNATNQEKLPAERVKQEIVKIVTNIIKIKPISSTDEFDYLTSKFGAYFGQLIHSDVMKQRYGQQHSQFRSVNTNQLINRQFSFQQQSSISNQQTPKMPIPNTPNFTQKAEHTQQNSIQTNQNSTRPKEPQQETKQDFFSASELVESKLNENVIQTFLNKPENKHEETEQNSKTIEAQNTEINKTNNTSNNQINESNMSKSSTDQSDDWFY